MEVKLAVASGTLSMGHSLTKLVHFARASPLVIDFAQEQQGHTGDRGRTSA
jgi:hypothetical protein